MRRLLRWLIVLGVLVGLACAVVVPASAWWAKRSAPKFVTSKVTRGRVETAVNSTGTVKPVRSVSIGAFVSGPIAEIFVDFNSRVTKDQLLARIDPRLLRAAVERDLAAVAQGEATLATQQADLARVEALLQQALNNEDRARRLLTANKDYLSDVEMDQYYFNRRSLDAQKELAKAAIAQAKATIAQARATLKNSETNLGYTEIKSPVDGVVIERKVDPGQTVAASFQTPELFIVAPELDKHVHVFATVDEADIGLIRAAQERSHVVKFTVDAYPNDLFEGLIFQVRKNSTTNQNVVTYPVVIAAKNSGEKLLPGMTANISFQIEAKEGVLRVPSAALRFVPPPLVVRPEDRHHLEAIPTAPAEEGARLTAQEKAALAKKRAKRLVWVQDNGLLRAVPVTLGLADHQNSELLGGELAEGQEVVTGAENVPNGPGGRP
jgi:HlyD family secretion protein